MDRCRRTFLAQLALACCFLLAAGWSKQIVAYPAPVDFNGKILRWDISLEQPDVTYDISFDKTQLDESLLTIVNESVNLWNGVSESYAHLRSIEAGEQPDVQITFQPNLDGAPHSSGYSVFLRGEDGNPSGCEIYVATSDASYNAIAKTVLHEFGHCLGLGHSLIGEAIMSYELDKNRFALDLDDEAALSLLYPADGTTPALPIGCSMGPHRTSTPWSSQLCFGLLCLPLVLILLGELSGSNGRRN